MDKTYKIVISLTNARIWTNISIKIRLLPKNQLKNSNRGILFLVLIWDTYKQHNQRKSFLRKQLVYDQIFQYIMQKLDKRNWMQLNIYFL